VRRANDAGENTSRKELLAALLLAAPDDPSALSSSVRRYRTATASAVVPADEDPAAYLSERERRPGPRRRAD
jgi:hypothetical protein